MKQLLCLIEETDAPQQANVFAWRSAKDWSSGTKSTSGPRGYEGKQIKPLIKIKIAFLLPKYFSWQWKLWKRRQRKKMGCDQWCHYCGCSGFSHTERSAETSTQHLQQSSKVHVNWYEQTQRKAQTSFKQQSSNSVGILKADTDTFWNKVADHQHILLFLSPPKWQAINSQ